MRLKFDSKPLLSFFLGLLTAVIALTPTVSAEDIPPCPSLMDPGATIEISSPPEDSEPTQTPVLQDAPAPETATPPPLSGTLRFTEFLPDPIGDDAAEFIELHNPETSAVSTTGWIIIDAKGKRLTVPTTTVEPGSYHQFTYGETKLRLTNTGGSFTLEDTTGIVRDRAAYASPVPSGKSFALVGDAWRWSVPSPGQENPDDAPLPEPAVTNTDSVANVPPAVPTQTPTPVATSTAADSSLAIGFSALLPNPDGDDAVEWIELRNAGTAEAALDDWKIADLANVMFAMNGKRIAAGATLRVMKSESHISLNNTEEEIRLIAPDASVRETIRYEDAPSGVAYERDAAGAWKWHEEPETVIAGLTDADESELAEMGEGLAEAESSLHITDLDALDDGESVIIEAVVTLPTGMIGKTMFAVRDAEQEAGLFVRMYGSGPFPAFAKGETVRIVGRVKKEDTLRLSSTAKEVMLVGAARRLAAVSRSPGDIMMEDEGLEAEVRGVVTGRGKRWISLSDETASSEIYARLASGEAPGAEEGDAITATGVIRAVNGNLELVVTDPSLLQVEATGPVGEATSKEGASAAAPTIERRPVLDFIARTEKSSLSAWVAAAAITTTGVLGYLVWRKRDEVLDEADGL